MKIGGDDPTAELQEHFAGTEIDLAHKLAEIKQQAPIAPTYFEELMVACCKKPMPLLRQWFEQELKELCQRQDPIWGDLLQVAIVAAASTQCPATLNRPDLLTLWTNLLDHPRFGRYAHHALKSVQTHSLSVQPINGWQKPAPNPASA